MSLPTIASVISVSQRSLGRVNFVPQQLVHFQWLAGLRDAAAVQAVFEQLLRTHQRTAAPALLIDERLAGPFKEEAKHWLIEQGLPLLTQLPAYSRVAIVLANDVYARLSAVPVLAASKGLRLPSRVFTTESEAQAWLREAAPSAAPARLCE